ncbi:MAG: hypothetical protein K0S39_4501, partial [Paenibacillus sp.]|nr:hypothetical protein [Paenibacillus sp.]
MLVISLLWGLITPAFPVVGASESPAWINETKTVTRQVGELLANGKTVNHSVYQSVYRPETAPVSKIEIAPPVLKPVPNLTNQKLIEVEGTAKPKSTVTVQYSLNSGAYAIAGSTVVSDVPGADIGPFKVPVILLSEGEYSISATAEYEGTTSQTSNVLDLTVDLTAPDSPYLLSWSNPSYDQIELIWEPPTVPNPDGSGTYIPDPDIDHYEVVKDGVSIKDTKLPYHLESNVPEMTYAHFEVYSVDKAGNRSESPYEVTAASFHKQAALLFQAVNTDEGRESFWDSVMSKDGSTIAFVSSIPDLESAGSPPPGAGDYSLYVHRSETGKTTRLGDAPYIYDANGVINLNADGRYAVYATNKDMGGNSILAVYDTVDRKSEPVAQMNGYASNVSVSDDAMWIAFSSEADNLVSGDTNGQSDVFLYNRITKQMKRISAGSGEEQANAGSGQPAISGNGKYIAFSSEATNLIPGGHGSMLSRLFLYSTETGLLEHIPVRGGSGSEKRAWGPNLSRDGNIVAYSANHDQRVEENRVFVLDRQSGVHQKTADIPADLNISMTRPRLSADGRYIILDYNNYSGNLDTISTPFNSSTGSIRIDLKTSEFKQVGNRAKKTNYSDISADGNRALFLQDHAAVYTVCFEACGTTQPDTAIQRAGWYAEQSVHGQPLPGSEIVLQAYGTAGQKLKAVVTYKDQAGSLHTEEKDLQANNGSDTMYSGRFVLPANAAELTSFKAVNINDPDLFKDAPALPAPVAGILKVQVEIQPEYQDLLRGSNIVLWSEANRLGNSVKLKDQMEVSLGLGAAADYLLKVIDPKGKQLVQHSGVVIERGKEAVLAIDVRPASELSVTLRSEDDGGLIYQAKVDLIDNNGNVLNTAKTDYKGEVKFVG